MSEAEDTPPQVPAPSAKATGKPTQPPMSSEAAPAPSSAAAPPPELHATPDPWAHRRGEPRTFAAIWILFVFMATVVTIGAVGVFGILSTDVYRPAARGLLEIVTVGIVVLWPMVRLSQEAPAHPFKAMLVDLLVVVLPAQV